MTDNLFNPGVDNLPAGAYIEVTASGQPLENARIVHIDLGDRLPPTGEKGRKWTKHLEK